MTPLKFNDQCIGRHMNFPQYNGAICTILSQRNVYYSDRPEHIEIWYLVRWEDGNQSMQANYQLKKIDSLSKALVKQQYEKLLAKVMG